MLTEAVGVWENYMTCISEAVFPFRLRSSPRRFGNTEVKTTHCRLFQLIQAGSELYDPAALLLKKRAKVPTVST
jgi:hypothetical protein